MRIWQGAGYCCRSHRRVQPLTNRGEEARRISFGSKKGKELATNGNTADSSGAQYGVQVLLAWILERKGDNVQFGLPTFFFFFLLLLKVQTESLVNVKCDSVNSGGETTTLTRG